MALPTVNKQDFGNSLDLVDIKEFRDNTVIMNDGSYRQILMVSGVNFALKSETEQNIITQGYQTFLNGVDFPLQILIHSRKVNIDRYIEALQQRKEVEESPILQNQIDEYTEFVKGFVQKNAIMEKVFLVVVPFYPSFGNSSTLKKASSFIPFLGSSKGGNEKAAKLSAEEAEKQFHEDLAQLSQRVSQVMNGILGMGLECTLLDQEQLTELFYNFYNPQTIERKNIVLPTEPQQ